MQGVIWAKTGMGTGYSQATPLVAPPIMLAGLRSCIRIGANVRSGRRLNTTPPGHHTGGVVMSIARCVPLPPPTLKRSGRQLLPNNFDYGMPVG
jgi:hypothetical protein